ncbi:hypothetical protein AJ80_06701 [Polytolypa hystricis UAMH7299]|uniref:Major facilitator superfamily (MFS) profile domain-containing protein n=1 Tax=Polytolypa hystricis (strain UAMH7299) TaxID=1447883 RepID=A0A2B7XU72_POLH7|nr:hypothetical protein AJ80_06701 [Polytolypa hystricis UAMH7299]
MPQPIPERSSLSDTVTSGNDSRDEEEKQFQPICPGANNEEQGRRLSRQESRRSSHSLDRACSISDGYSHPAVNNDKLQEPKDEEDAVTRYEGEYIVKWTTGLDEENPRNMSLARKWLIVIVLSAGSVCVTCTSSIYTMAYSQLMEQFECSRIVATLGLSLFILGLGLGPLVLGPLSEFYGRRMIYIVSFSFFVIWLIPCAVAQNIQTLLISRFFNGLSGSAFLSVAGGTVGDIFDRSQLAAPMMIYTASPFIGPELGPLLGGFICQNVSWRWIFYVLLAWAGSIAVAIVLFVPETYHPVLLRNRAIRLRKETGDERWQAPIEQLDRSVAQTVLRSIYRPMLLLTLEPMCLNLCIFSAILLGILYLFFGAFHLVFTDIYGFDMSQVGMSFLGLLVGMLIAISSDPFWRRNYSRLVRHRENKSGKIGEYEPEWRLPPAIAGAPLVSVGMFIFAWTIYPHVHWIVPIIGSAIFSSG